MPIYKIENLEVGPIIDNQSINVENAKIAALALIAEKTGAGIMKGDVIESAKPIQEEYNFIHEINCKVKLAEVHP